MTLENVISMLGAVAVFLFGMTTLTGGLEKLAGGKLGRVLERLTGSALKGILVGALVTALIQSSGATTVMCVGFVNAGIMTLEQAVGVIMGANIGTTATAQLLRLSSLSGEGSLLLALLRPTVLGPLLSVAGIIPYLFFQGSGQKNIGQVLLGLGILFTGMNALTAAVAPLQDAPWLQALFTVFSNPLLGLLVGAAVTALLQSSTAFTGILQALSTTGAIRFHTAIPLILGQNIGSTVTALLSGAGASKNAKRVSLIHLLFNLIGSTVFLAAVYAGNALLRFPFWAEPLDMGGVADLHLLFNLACTALLLPFHRLLVKAARRIIPDNGEASDPSLLDPRFLATPSIALERAHDAVLRMGAFAWENFRLSAGLLEQFDEDAFSRVSETENTLDRMQEDLSGYLVRLTRRDLTPAESRRVSGLIHSLSDFERIGDYAFHVAQAGQTLHASGLSFSPDAQAEVKTLSAAVDQTISCTLTAAEESSRRLALLVAPLEQEVDRMCGRLRASHIQRLQTGDCPAELSVRFLELLFHMERISDHCSNVATGILRETASQKA